MRGERGEVLISIMMICSMMTVRMIMMMILTMTTLREKF